MIFVFFRSLNPRLKTFCKRDDSEKDKNTTKQTINILVFSFFFFGIFYAYQNVRDTCIKICDQFVLSKSCKCDFYMKPKHAGREYCIAPRKCGNVAMLSVRIFSFSSFAFNWKPWFASDIKSNGK